MPETLLADRRTEPSRWTRFRVRWKSRDLDSQLADGADPEQSDELSLRAEQLREPGTRGRIATGIENLFRLATVGPGPGATTALTVAPFDRNRVAANADELAGLAERLRGEAPHGVRGLAMASILFEDSGSPLYAHTQVDELKPAIRSAVLALG